MLTSAFRPGGRRAILAAWSLASRRSSAAPPSSGRSSSALAAARAGRGAAILVAGEAGIGKTRLAAEIAGRARRRVRRPCSAGRSISSAQSCHTSRSPKPCCRSGARRPATPRRVPAPGVRGDAGAAHRPRVSHAAAARARGPALGRHVDARPGRLPRPQSGRTTGVLLATYRQTSHHRRGAWPAGRRRAALGFRPGARPRPAPARGPGGAARPASAAALAPAAGRRDRRPLGGNPFFAEELLAAGGADAELPHRLRDLLLQRVERLDPAARTAAPGRRRRARRRLPIAPRARRASRARRARRAAPGRRARGPGRRPGRGHLPVPPPLLAEPSTRRSSPASARSCTPGWPRSCPAPRPPRRPSWRRTGRPRAAPPRR